MKMKLEGAITALVTPFKEDGELDREGMKKNIRHQLEAGVDGILVLGTTGESPTLSDQERCQVIELAVREVAGRAVVMVGTGTNCTAKTIDYTREAKELGADAALIVTPYYNLPTQEGIFRHFEEVSCTVDMPICVYNHVKRTGRNIEIATLKRIATLPTVVAVKEASGSIDQVQDFIAKVGLPVLSGDDAMTLPVMTIGGVGVISVTSNLVPEVMVELVRAAKAGDFATARTLHYRLLPLFRALCLEPNPIPIKAAMDEWKMPAGGCRLPLTPMQGQAHAQLCEVLAQHLT